MRLMLSLCLLAFAANTCAAPRVEKVSWKDAGKNFDGVLVWDDASTTQRPGLVMVPNWYGVNEQAIAKAQTLAGSEYVILLADVYGRGIRPTSASEAGKAVGAATADPAALRARASAALATLRAAAGKTPLDVERIGAIGFCFGGMVALELARSGADIDGVATFHASLGTSMPAASATFKTPVLVMNGADDKNVSDESIAAFETEMRQADADWQFVNYGGAVHCFAEPDETGAANANCKFHEPSYRRGVEAMNHFFAATFGEPAAAAQ